MASAATATAPSSAKVISHYYLGLQSKKVFAFQQDANGEEVVTVDLYPTDKRLNAQAISRIVSLAIGEAPPAVSPIPVGDCSPSQYFLKMDWIERLEYALAHPENLRTAVEFNQKRGYLRGKGLEYYRYSGENFLEEIRSGRQFSDFNESQKGLIRCIVDAGFRRGDFSGLDFYEG
jgi:hypothetical protein